MVTQNRRYMGTIQAFSKAVREGTIGEAPVLPGSGLLPAIVFGLIPGGYILFRPVPGGGPHLVQSGRR